MIPFKKFEQMCDLATNYANVTSRENQDALIKLQDSLGFPWSMSAPQRQDWGELGARLDRYVAHSRAEDRR